MKVAGEEWSRLTDKSQWMGLAGADGAGPVSVGQASLPLQKGKRVEQSRVGQLLAGTRGQKGCATASIRSKSVTQTPKKAVGTATSTTKGVVKPAKGSLNKVGANRQDCYRQYSIVPSPLFSPLHPPTSRPEARRGRAEEGADVPSSKSVPQTPMRKDKQANAPSTKGVVKAKPVPKDSANKVCVYRRSLSAPIISLTPISATDQPVDQAQGLQPLREGTP